MKTFIMMIIARNSQSKLRRYLVTVSSKKSNLTYRVIHQHQSKRKHLKCKRSSLIRYSLNPNSKCPRLKINLGNSLRK